LPKKSLIPPFLDDERPKYPPGFSKNIDLDHYFSVLFAEY